MNKKNKGYIFFNEKNNGKYRFTIKDISSFRKKDGFTVEFTMSSKKIDPNFIYNVFSKCNEVYLTFPYMNQKIVGAFIMISLDIEATADDFVKFNIETSSIHCHSFKP